MSTQSSVLRFATICLLGALSTAGKCVPFDPALDPTSPGGLVPGEAPGDGPATPCPAKGEARLTVESFSYKIQCGCREDTGKICTVPAGTRVVWTFADSTAHNVTSLAHRFGASTNELVGRFDHIFASPGTYGYGCTIHPYDMSDYQVVVLE